MESYLSRSPRIPCSSPVSQQAHLPFLPLRGERPCLCSDERTNHERIPFVGRNACKQGVEVSFAVDRIAHEPLDRHRDATKQGHTHPPGTRRFLEPHGLRNRACNSATPEAWIVTHAFR